jgi:hypothetical protein
MDKQDMQDFNKIKILKESSWDDENSDLFGDDPVEDAVDASSALKANAQSLEALKSLENLDKLDKEFDQFYKSALKNDDDIELYSAKVQRFELGKVSSFYKLEKESKEFTQEEDEENDRKTQEELQKLFNNESNDILKCFKLKQYIIVEKIYMRCTMKLLI